jgi:hypothetical protein
MKAFIKMLPALVFVAAAAWATGCGIETQVIGVVVDEDLNDLRTMLLLARGTNSELTDVVAATEYARIVWAGTDEGMEGASTSQRGNHRNAVSDYHLRPGGGVYSQAMEASWAGILSAQRIATVDEREGVDPTTDPLIGRMWLNAGIAERQLGEMFCNANYGFGPEGGMLLEGQGKIYDSSVIVSNDSILRRAITFADLAIENAQAALAAGVEVPDGWYLFDPQVVLTSAYGLKAQAHLILEEWQLADQFAALVLSQPPGMLPPSQGNIWPGGSGIDYIEYTHYNDDAEDNDVHYEFHRDDESGLWNTPAALQWADDPRVPQVRCGEFKEGVTPGGSKRSSDFHNYSDRPGCALEMTNEYRNENNRYPRWVQLKYLDRGSDYEIITGTEMVLIRAEVALRAGNMAAFEGFINELRAHWSLPPLAESDPQAFPLVAGALEYPNAEDDAWSILDRERYLELWLEGRRHKDMWRWEHPFWTEGHYITPEQADMNPPGPRPYMCHPLPSNECGSNEQIRTEPICQRLDPPGG